MIKPVATVSVVPNLPPSLERLYELAYNRECKGVTIYRDKSRENQVLSTGKTAHQAEGVEKRAVRERPVALTGSTYKIQTGCGPLYVTINEDEAGPFEVFTTMGKAGGCAASQNEAIGRMVSLAWRSGVQPKQVIKQLLDISCHSPSGFGEKKILSCADAVAKAIQLHIASSGDAAAETIIRESKISGACPECGGRVAHEEGCAHCHCGYSQCG